MNYILNSKNRKLKTRIVHLTSRLKFGWTHIASNEKYTLIAVGFLLLSLFLPWFQVFFSDDQTRIYYSYEGFTGIALPLIALVSLGTLFFLFSHTKKEKIRPYIFGGAMDGQIYMFFAMITLAVLLDILSFSRIFEQFASGASPVILSGYITAFIGALGLSLSGYLLMKREKKEITQLAYIARGETKEFTDYQDILHNVPPNPEKQIGKSNKKNMRLPI